MKRFLVMTVCLCMLVMCIVGISSNAHAANVDDLIFQLNDDGTGYSVSIGSTDAVGNLVIPATYNGLPVTSIEYCAFNGCSSLTSISIPESIASIGEWSFANCSSLMSITIPENVISIGEGAFSNCSTLSGIWVDEDNPNYSSDCYGVLFDKNKTHLIQAPGHLSGSYAIPHSVISVDIRAFSECSNLVNIIIPENVTSIGSMAFWNCSNLKSVSISDGVTSIGDWSFFGCSSLTSIDIPDSVTSIGNSTFSKCSSLTSIDIPNSLTSIGSSAFSGCSSLTNIRIPDGVTLIGDFAFSGCSSLSGIWVDEDNSNYSSDIHGVLFDKNKTELIYAPCTLSGSYFIPDSVSILGDWAFEDCSGLVDITIPYSMTSIGEYAFYFCSGLECITIPPNVTSIGYQAFIWCSGLSGIWVDENNSNYCSDSYGVLFDKNKTELIKAPATLSGSYIIPTSVSNIGDFAFGDCSALVSVTIPYSVTRIGEGGFVSCSELKDVYYEKSKEQWDIIAIDSFGNNNLTSATIHYSHLHDYTVIPTVTTEPNCMTDGYTKYTCVCGYSYVDAYVDALGHNWDEGIVTLEPTEEKEGVRVYGCTRCNEEKTERIPTLDHVHRYTSAETAPTCTEQGFTTHTCKCGESYIDTHVPALEHREVIDKDVEATCTAPGLTEGKHCDVCGEVLLVQTEVPAKGHSYVEAITAPTCMEQGYTTYTCVCGDSYVGSYTDALGHTLGDWVTVKEPNYLENGERTRSCVRCDVFESEEIDNTPFTDVGDGNRFKTPILWAYYEGITSGKTETTFEPNSEVTRAQFVTFLWRSAGSPEPKSQENPFTDVSSGNRFLQAILWAYHEGITSGTTATTFSPNNTCTRGQVVMFLYRYAGSPEVKNVKNPFTDVSSGNRFHNAILWAYSNGITTGKTATTFEINSSCTRAQVVTFLYRNIEE